MVILTVPTPLLTNEKQTMMTTRTESKSSSSAADRRPAWDKTRITAAESYEISRITFGVLSPEEIISMSACEVHSTNFAKRNSVYDPRMGELNVNKECITCGLPANSECPGHPGHIRLSIPLIHPLYYRNVLDFLRCVCIKCYRLLLTAEQLYVTFGPVSAPNYSRYHDRIVDKISVTEICSHCNNTQPTITFSKGDCTYTMKYKDRNDDCTSPVVTLSVEQIRKILENVSTDDVKLIGLNPRLLHPKNLVMSVMPVLPPAARPYVISDGQIHDDDLSTQLVEIIKINNNIRKLSMTHNNENAMSKLVQTLRFRIETFYDNTRGKAKHPTNNNRPIKGIKSRLSGKNGIMRASLMGKRVEFSGRTVAGPGPSLGTDEIGVPPEIAENLTIPVPVQDFNYNVLSEIVNTGRANFIEKPDGRRINIKYARNRRGTPLKYGDQIHRGGGVVVYNNNPAIQLRKGDRLFRDGREITNITLPSIKKLTLVKGDVIHRHLRDGDHVVVNRQPTLWIGSMQSKKVRVIPGKTLRGSISCTSLLNMDFDGDELNIHVAQSPEAMIEMQMLSKCSDNMINVQSGKPAIKMVQDNQLGAYLMTNGLAEITREQFMNLSYQGGTRIDGSMLYTSKKISQIKRVFKAKARKGNPPKPVWCGHALFSLLLPDDFIYERETIPGRDDEPVVKITSGVMYEGVLTKVVLGASKGAIHQLLRKEYSLELATRFIDNVQLLTNAWMMTEGFSIGLGDCKITSDEVPKAVRETVTRCMVESDKYSTDMLDSGVREANIVGSLNKARDIGMKIAKDGMSDSNRFLSTVRSGSKGDFFNIAQITGLLGQQNVSQGRISPTLNNNTRILPHYPFGKLPTELEYESRGFITSSFSKGLSPVQYYLHAISGRESICDTAQGTATSGYIQRRIVKITEDITVQYNGTVMDNSKKLYNFDYGFDPRDTIGKEDDICNIDRLAARLNLQAEQEDDSDSD